MKGIQKRVQSTILVLFSLFLFTSSQVPKLELIETIKNVDNVVLCRLSKITESKIEFTEGVDLDNSREFKGKIQVRLKHLSTHKKMGAKGTYVLMFNGKSRNIKSSDLKLAYQIIDSSVLLTQISWQRLQGCGFTGHLDFYDDFKVSNYDNSAYTENFGHKIGVERFINIVHLIRMKDKNHKELIKSYENGTLEYAVCNCLM